MKLLLIGVLLIVYAMFLTPCFFEPSDIVVSTAYIAGATSMGVPTWAIILWIISGYVALMIGLSLGVHFAVFKIKHPLAVGIIIAIIVIVICYLLYLNNLIQF